MIIFFQPKVFSLQIVESCNKKKMYFGKTEISDKYLHVAWKNYRKQVSVESRLLGPQKYVKM